MTLRFLAHIVYIAWRVLDNNAQPEVLFPVGLKAMVCCVILYRLYGLYKYVCACAGTSTEADKSDVTEHPRDD